MPTVTFNPFVSKSGFKSEGFAVDAAGNLTANNINSEDIVASSIDTSVIKLNGVTLFGSEGDSSAPNVFDITGDFIVSEGSTPYLSVINGQVVINNRFDSTGKIDNVDIGSITPAEGTFIVVNTPILENATGIDLTINGTTVAQITSAGIVDTSINNTSIGSTTASTGAFTSVTINDQPTGPSSATRKDYVDNQITAFSIAFGV